MSSYTVRQVADMLKTNEETVRRWIRAGKLTATQNSKKSGNIISSNALDEFIKATPKYADSFSSWKGSSSETSSPSPFSIYFVIGMVLGTLVSLLDEKKDSVVSESDVENVLKKEIILSEKAIKDKNLKIQKLKKEIEEEQKNLDNYKYAIDNLDLKLIAAEINGKKKGSK